MIIYQCTPLCMHFIQLDSSAAPNNNPHTQKALQHTEKRHSAAISLRTLRIDGQQCNEISERMQQQWRCQWLGVQCFFLVFSCILIKSSCIDVIWTLFLVLSSSQRRPLPPILAPSLYRCISNSFRISGISRCRYRLLYFIFSACNRLRSIQCKCTEPNVCNSFRNFKFGFGVCVCLESARDIYIFVDCWLMVENIFHFNLSITSRFVWRCLSSCI